MSRELQYCHKPKKSYHKAIYGVGMCYVMGSFGFFQRVVWLQKDPRWLLTSGHKLPNCDRLKNRISKIVCGFSFTCTAEKSNYRGKSDFSAPVMPKLKNTSFQHP